MSQHEFGDRLRGARIRAKTTDHDVDTRLGLAPGTCRDWETQRVPKPTETMVVRLALLLGCDADYLDDGLSAILQRSMTNLIRFADDNHLSPVERDDLWGYAMEANRRYRRAISYEEWLRLWSHRKGAAGPNPYEQPRLFEDF